MVKSTLITVKSRQVSLCGFGAAVSADILQTADPALRMPCDADCPSVIDESVTEIAAFLRRNDFPQFPLDLCRLSDIVHKTDQIAEADAVCICDDGRLSEDVSHHQIGTLSSYTGELQKLPHRIRDTIMILFVQHPHAAGDISGLARPQAAGSDNLFGAAAARAATDGNFAKSFGVIISTRLSVHCAASRTLTNSCQASSYASVQ